MGFGGKEDGSDLVHRLRWRIDVYAQALFAIIGGNVSFIRGVVSIGRGVMTQIYPHQKKREKNGARATKISRPSARKKNLPPLPQISDAVYHFREVVAPQYLRERVRGGPPFMRLV